MMLYFNAITRYSHIFHILFMAVISSSSTLSPLLAAQIENNTEDTYADSNLVNFNYPSHQCANKPIMPAKIPVLASFSNVDNDNLAIAKYNMRVVIYNKNIKQYKTCINNYIRRGNNDIKIIRDQLNTTLQDAKKH